jgi:hypothetical protein
MEDHNQEHISLNLSTKTILQHYVKLYRQEQVYTVDTKDKEFQLSQLHCLMMQGWAREEAQKKSLLLLINLTSQCQFPTGCFCFFCSELCHCLQLQIGLENCCAYAWKQHGLSCTNCVAGCEIPASSCICLCWDGDSQLPMLGLTHDELQFQRFSKI